MDYGAARQEVEVVLAQPTDPAKIDNVHRNTPTRRNMKIGASNLLLFPSYAREKANTIKVFDGLTLNADAFVWLRELVARRAREMLILQQELPSPVSRREARARVA